MSEILFLSPDYIKQNSTVSNNLNDSILIPIIKDVQTSKLLLILGESLYNKINSLLENDSIEGTVYNILYERFIQMYILFSVQAELTITNYQHQHNAGSVQYVDTNYSNIQLNEIKYFKQYWENKASVWGERMVNYLEANSSDFPEYRQHLKGGIHSSDTATVFSSGLVLNIRKHKCTYGSTTNSSSEQDVSDLLDEIERLKREKAELEIRISTLTTNNNQLTEEVITLQEQLNTVNNRIAELENEVENLINENSTLSTENQELRDYINSLPATPDTPDVPTDTDTYNILNFTNISERDGVLTIQDKVDISNMEYSLDSYTFSKVEERLFGFPKKSTIYLKWEGDCNLDKDSESCFFTTTTDTMVSGILRNGDIDREYRGLFYGVQSIIDVSNLIFRSEYLGEQSMASAFRESGITKTPTIEATKFGVACFDACYMNSSLQKATKFKVEECETDSFLFMYRGCPNLHNVEIETTQWDVECFREWLIESASEGYLYSNFENIPIYTDSGLPYGWKRKVEKVTIEDELVEHNKDTSDWDYLVFNNNTFSYAEIKINNVDTYVDRFEYSTDGGGTFYYTDRNVAPLYPNSETIIRWEGKLNQPYLHDSWNYNAVFHIENAFYSISGELKHGNETYNYACMFKNEWWLRSAEDLRLTSDIVGDSAYEILFYGCSNLQFPPQITATTVYNRGCCEMFNNCKSLQYAPELTATNLYYHAYFSMFNNCSSLNYVKITITDWDSYATERWLGGNVASEGTIETNATNIPTNSSSGVPTGWTVIPIVPKVDENEDFLLIENVDEVEGTVLMNNPNEIAIQYSTDGNSFNKYTTASEIPIGIGEKVYFKWRDIIGKGSTFKNIVHSNVKYKVYGELKKGNNQNAYYCMFYQESNLVDASQLKLTATNLKSTCYYKMFGGCTSLTTTPTILPSTELAPGCYQYMFSECTSLTTTPTILPSTELAESCYHSMFYKCSSLTTAPQLPSTQLKKWCYNQMFYKCSSLTTAPTLPATELEYQSYYEMFSGCTKLNYVKHHIIEWNASYTQSWLSDVASNGTVECPIDSTIPSGDTSGVPNGWTRVDIQ